MANTIIQIKRSTTTTAPASLSVAEQAYSYLSDKLFIGNTAGTGVVEIGGKYWVDTTQAAYVQANTARTHANAAFETANNAAAASNTSLVAAFAQANTARDHANAAHVTANASFVNSNAAFNQANTARTHANAAHLTANAGFDQANTARTHANAAHLTANAGFDQANTARVHANAAHLTANAGFDQANTARTHANAGFLQANTARDHANAAFAFANTRFSSSGGTITGNVSIVGDLVISGNTYQINATELRVSDPLIYLAGNNYSSDIVDIGFIANYVNATGSNVHTGFYREHQDKMWYLFQGYDAEPANNHIGALSNNMTLAVLNADVRTSNLLLGGVNAITWISSSYVQANTARDQANAAFLQANSSTSSGSAAFLQANTARDHANAAHLTANAAFVNSNAAFDQANTARTHANAAHLTANAAFVNSNAAFDQANTARTHANAAHLTANAGFVQANTARDHANAAFDKANASFTAANTAASNAVNASALSTGTVPSGRLTGSYTGITGVGTLTVGTWNADVIKVPYGGTGVTSFTTNGILYGNNAGDLKVTSAGTEGQVLQASATGVPQFGMLDGGTF